MFIQILNLEQFWTIISLDEFFAMIWISNFFFWACIFFLSIFCLLNCVKCLFVCLFNDKFKDKLIYAKVFLDLIALAIPMRILNIIFNLPKNINEEQRNYYNTGSEEEADTNNNPNNSNNSNDSNEFRNSYQNIHIEIPKGFKQNYIYIIFLLTSILLCITSILFYCKTSSFIK